MEHANNELIQLCQQAVAAKASIQQLSTKEKRQALSAVANDLLAATEYLLVENSKDIDLARSQGMHEGLVDRLLLTKDRIASIADGILKITLLEDPIGELLDSHQHPNGMQIDRIRVPMGVIGIIYESRPNVTADAFALCFMTSNVVILKGGKDALYSNQAITTTIRKSLAASGICEDVVGLITSTDRETTRQFMKMNRYVDVLIPRGGASLIQSVVEESNIPVIETGTGNCHIYIDEFADLEMAYQIVINAKTQRIGVCNACESLVVHQAVAEEFLTNLPKRMDAVHAVTYYADERSSQYITDALPATEDDFAREYLDYKCSVAIVDSVREAVHHINHYSTGHSDAIISNHKEHCDYFLQTVDSACVYANASTRFTDGYEFGFGAEIGISTQKLHARGPMGLRELTSYKYVIRGNGQVRA